MDKLVAKPVLQNKHWILIDTNGKIGNVHAVPNGYKLSLSGTTSTVTSLTDLHQFVNFTTVSEKRTVINNEYPMPKRVYNVMYDIKHRLQLFTKQPKSKCYYVSGWFRMRQNDMHSVVYCPKYIFVLRYPYEGPFKTKEQAENMNE